MLVVAGGAFKSGSTWQYHILNRILQYDSRKFEVLPEQYAERIGWQQQTIESQLLLEFLEKSDYINNNFLFKYHIRSKEEKHLHHLHLLLSDPNIYIMNIKRDVRDVVVSAYHHFSREGNYTGKNFKDFYWEKGRRVADNDYRYHRLLNISSSRVYTSSYELLKKNSMDEIIKMSEFLKISISASQAREIESNTSFNALRTSVGKHREGFFRKGVSGDWKRYFDAEMLEDVSRIEKHGLSKVERFRSLVYYGLKLFVRKRQVSK